MGTSENRLTLEVNVRVEAREGHWAATMERFPITVYGDSQLAAEGRVLEALQLLLLRHAHSAESLSKYLTARGVSHVVEATPIAGVNPRPYVVAQSHRRVTVPVGV
jgi:hypothetical protein